MNEAIAQTLPKPSTHSETVAFGDLYENTFPRVYAYVCSVLRDQSAAEDVTAQAFERAYRKRKSFRPGRGSAEAWIFGIARNAALDELRRRKRHAVMTTEPEDVESRAVEDLADLTLRRETVRTALDGLDAREREMVALKFMAGLGNTEIAKVLGLSESNTSTKLHRTITKLREACNDRI